MEITLTPQGLGLPFEVEAEDGHTYRVSHFEASPENLEELWRDVGQYGVLFGDHRFEGPEVFYNFLMSPSIIVVIVENCGVFCFNGVSTTTEGEVNMHFNFWDRRTDRRQKLILTVMNWLFETFLVRRINYGVPQTDFAALSRAKNLGFKLEGIKRSCVNRAGRWSDLFMFGILRSELTPKALESRRIYREITENQWFDQIREERKDYFGRRNGAGSDQS